MEDLYEAGVDVIHPLQATAFDMGIRKKSKRVLAINWFLFQPFQSIHHSHGTPEDVIKKSG